MRPVVIIREHPGRRTGTDAADPIHTAGSRGENFNRIPVGPHLRSRMPLRALPEKT